MSNEIEKARELYKKQFDSLPQGLMVNEHRADMAKQYSRFREWCIDRLLEKDAEIKRLKEGFDKLAIKWEDTFKTKDAEIQRLKDEKEELKEQVDILGKDNEDVYKYVEKNIDLKERHKKEKEKMLDELEKKIKKQCCNYCEGAILEILTTIKNKYRELKK